MCVCGSMKPGATISPFASIVFAAVTRLVAALPTNVIRSPRMPTSARARRAAAAVDHRTAANEDVDLLLRRQKGAEQ